jgi:cytochrome c oxidase subunit 1
MYNKKTAIISWAIIFVGINVTYMSMMVVGILGMPRRYYDYLPEFAGLNMLATCGSWILVIGLALMFVNLFRGIFKGKPVGNNPWGGATLEWTISSPPPHENFDEDPVVTHGPYDFKKAGLL